MTPCNVKRDELYVSPCSFLNFPVSALLTSFFFSTPRYNHTFEIYSESERLYLFGTDDSEVKSQWVKSIAKVTIKYIYSA